MDWYYDITMVHRTMPYIHDIIGNALLCCFDDTFVEVGFIATLILNIKYINESIISLIS